jgi:D-cysteine desulfhydrase family pyridoxal phosphate-dependent enzyme
MEARTTLAQEQLSWGALKSRLNQLPRLHLANLPTPLDELERLSAHLGGPRILMKRDDLTGLAFGGNKTRKLEFLMADLLHCGCNSIITYAASQSNYCRQVAAAAAKVGVRAHLVLFKSVHNEWQGNLLLDDLLGAEIHFIEGDFESAPDEAKKLAARLSAEGEKPYLADLMGAAVPVVFPAYLLAAEELHHQLQSLDLVPDWVVLTSGSGVTHASLALGLKLLGSTTRVLGISIRKPERQGREDLLHWVQLSSDQLKIGVRLEPEELYYLDQYRGEGYARPTPETIEAIRIVAETEGIFLDPVYTGKAMAGLVTEIRKGTFKRGQTLVFLHTGGTPALFAYNQELHAN